MTLLLPISPPHPAPPTTEAAMMTMLTMEAGKIVHDSEWGQFTSATLDKDEEAGGCGASMDGDQEEACGGASTVGNEDDAPLMLPPPNTWIARFPVELEWQRVTGPTRGLNNLGNSCFMNATLQCLAAIPALQHLLTSLTVRDERVCVCVCSLWEIAGSRGSDIHSYLTQCPAPRHSFLSTLPRVAVCFAGSCFSSSTCTSRRELWQAVWSRACYLST